MAPDTIWDYPMSSLTKTASIKDVARLAGVSEQTVSRVAHNSDSVRPATKERVQAAMRELGYRPNFAGRSLRQGEFRTVGVVMLNMQGAGNIDRLEGFAEAADTHGYAITIAQLNEKPYTLNAAAQRMLSLPVDGMIVCMNRMTADFGTFEPPAGLKCVLISQLEHPICSTVDGDQRACSKMVVNYLLERGHKTVHFISSPERSLSGMQRELGWREAMEEAGIEPPVLIRGDWTAKSGYEAGLAFAADPTCTAIYASNDNMAYGCIKGLEAAGKRVPEDVSVVGVDDALGDIVPDLELTTVRFDNKRVGAWAVEKIAGINAPYNKKEHELIKPVLIERKTVRSL